MGRRTIGRTPFVSKSNLILLKNFSLNNKISLKYNKDGKYVGEYKNGEVWNGIVYDKNRNIKGTWVNGVKQ